MVLDFTSTLTVIMNLMLTVLKRRIRSVLCDFKYFIYRLKYPIYQKESLFDDRYVHKLLGYLKYFRLAKP